MIISSTFSAIAVSTHPILISFSIHLLRIVSAVLVSRIMFVTIANSSSVFVIVPVIGILVVIVVILRRPMTHSSILLATGGIMKRTILVRRCTPPCTRSWSRVFATCFLAPVLKSFLQKFFGKFVDKFWMQGFLKEVIISFLASKLNYKL